MHRASMSDAQFKALPGYVQRYIELLEKENAEKNDRIKILSGNVSGSNVVTYDYVNPERALGKDARVRFYMGGTHQEENSVCVNHNGPYELEVTTSGPGRLTFQPVSGNVMRVTLQDR